MKENVFSYIDSCINENKLSHAFFIETNNIDVFEQEIIDYLLKKQFIKNKEYINNLNLIIVKPDGKEIKSAEIDLLKNRFATKPSNDLYNVYIINSADKLNNSAANKLLKFLEEPSESIIAFLIANKNSQTLSTIKSRCQSFQHEYSTTKNNMEYIDIFLDYIEQPNYQKELELRKKIKELERNDLINTFTDILSNIQNSLAKNNSINLLLLDKILHLLKSNVNMELVLDKFFIEVR